MVCCLIARLQTVKKPCLTKNRCVDTYWNASSFVTKKDWNSGEWWREGCNQVCCSHTAKDCMNYKVMLSHRITQTNSLDSITLSRSKSDSITLPRNLVRQLTQKVRHVSTKGYREMNSNRRATSGVHERTQPKETHTRIWLPAMVWFRYCVARRREFDSQPRRPRLDEGKKVKAPVCLDWSVH